jgi:hypothetical protein
MINGCRGRDAVRTSLVMWLLTMNACASSADPGPATPPGSRSTIGRPCSISRSSVASDGGMQAKQVWVEIAEVDADLEQLRKTQPDDISQGQTSLFDAPGITIRWSAYALASDGVAATLAVGVSPAPGRNPCQHRHGWCVRVTPRFDYRSPRQVHLAIEAAPPSESEPAQPSMLTTVVVDDQQTVVLGLREKRGSVLVVTPYIADSPEELRQIQQCKYGR